MEQSADNRLKYFIFNKESDYKRGYIHNLDILQNGIRIKKNSREKGIFISRLLDSRQTQMSWHRLRIRGNGKQGAAFRLSIYAGNQRCFVFRNKKMDLEDFIRCESVPLEEKLQYLSPWLQKQAAGQDEMLLHEVKGRYLWFVIELYRQQDTGGIFDIQIFFPGQSWMKYLPEIYQKADEDSFLERYLGIFQTIYEDLNDAIRQMPQNFDVETAQGDYLVWLAKWLGIEDSYIWSEKQLRQLLYNGVSLYKRRGTRGGLKDFVALYTGEVPFIVENHQLQYFRKDKRRFEKLQRLYGSSAYSFTVLVREQAVASRWKQKALIKIIEDIKPVQMEWRLVIIKPYIFADRYSYIGINSVLGKYANMALDGKSAVLFSVLEERRKQK